MVSKHTFQHICSVLNYKYVYSIQKSRRSATTTKIFVGSLPPGVTTDDLRLLFQPYGEIAECDVVNRCGFLHMENKELAMKAIEDLNNTNFMGGRISVEKGRSKPPPRDRDRNGFGGGRGGPRSNSYQGGPMRGSRENSRVGPYMRDGGGDYDRRPHGMMRNGGGYGGYDRLADPERSYSDMYGSIPSRAPVYDDHRGGYVEDHRGYGDAQIYDERRYYDDRRLGISGGMDHRLPVMGERRTLGGGYDDRRPILGERRPLLDHSSDMASGGMRAPMPLPPSFDRRSQMDMYSRREGLSKPMYVHCYYFLVFF